MEAASQGRQAQTLQDVLDIRAYNSQWLSQHTVGTAVGVRWDRGRPTGIPAIIAFVPCKVVKSWLSAEDVLPRIIVGRGSWWCDLDVMEFNPPKTSAKGQPGLERVYNKLVESLRGGGRAVEAGSQVMSDEGLFASIGPLLHLSSSHIGSMPTGFITTSSMFSNPEAAIGSLVYHPQTPRLGVGVPIGVVQAAVGTVSDMEWYGGFISERADVQVHVDSAYVAFPSDFKPELRSSVVAGLPGQIGPAITVTLDMTPDTIVGRRVAKVGRSTGLTTGRLLAYAVESYRDNAPTTSVLDFLIEADGQNTPFSEVGDAGAVVFMEDKSVGLQEGQGVEEMWHPMGLLWPFSSQCGRLHHEEGSAPSFWSAAVDLSRTLHHFGLRLQG